MGEGRREGDVTPIDSIVTTATVVKIFGRALTTDQLRNPTQLSLDH